MINYGIRDCGRATLDGRERSTKAAAHCVAAAVLLLIGLMRCVGGWPLRPQSVVGMKQQGLANDVT